MTIDARYIAASLWGHRLSASPERLAKAQKLAERAGVKWADVQAFQAEIEGA